MNKKGLLIALAAGLATLGLCFAVVAQPTFFNHNENTSKEVSSSSTSSKNASSDKNKDNTKVSKSGSMASVNGKGATASTNSNTVSDNVTYYFKGVNVPASVTLIDINGSNPMVKFTAQNGSTSTFQAQVGDAGSKNIRVFAPGNNAVKNVTASTQITLTNQVDGVAANPDIANGVLYLVPGSNGANLATPNYAGNTNESERDVMLELAQ